MYPTNKITTKTNKSNYNHTSSAEAKKTSSNSQKTQQVHTSGKNISQDIQNAKAIIDATPQENRKTMARIMDSKRIPTN